MPDKIREALDAEYEASCRDPSRGRPVDANTFHVGWNAALDAASARLEEIAKDRNFPNGEWSGWPEDLRVREFPT